MGTLGSGNHYLEIQAVAEIFDSVIAQAFELQKNDVGRKVVDDLASEGIVIRSPSRRRVAEEAPGAYKNVDAVVAAAEQAGLARRVARMRPLICIKG